MLESFIKEKGHLCLFLPKFHCEPNPIEMVKSIIIVWKSTILTVSYVVLVGANTATENIPKTILPRLKSVPIEYWMPVQKRSFEDLSIAHGDL